MKRLFQQKWTLILSITVFLLGSPLLQAQAFEKGYQAFTNGDYRKARGFLNNGLRQTRDRYDKALMYKLIGISEYKLGSKSKAAANFKKGLSLDPTLRINREESRDRRVLQLFAQVKKSSARGGRSMASGRRMGSRSRRAARSARSQAPRRAMMRQASSSDTSTVMKLLPFGIGQFAQGKTLLGAGLAIGQLSGLGLFVVQTNAASDADKEALAVINEFESNGEQNINRAEFEKYLDDNETFVLAARQEATIGMAIFGLLYAGGVAEAYLNPPGPPTRSMRGRRRGSVDQVPEVELAEGEVLESQSFAVNDYQDRRRFAFDLTSYQGKSAGVFKLNYYF